MGSFGSRRSFPRSDRRVFTFNQFLVRAEQPLLFHTGHRSMFGDVRDAITSVVPIERLRWIAFGHVESDECGAMNEFLAVVPDAQIAHGILGCVVSLKEMADRAGGFVFDRERDLALKGIAEPQRVCALQWQ